MDNNHTEDYVLVLEDRTEVQNASEVGKLSIISDINEEGELKTTSAEATNQSSFLKFNNQDGLLKNFMKNFLKQFNDPTRFGLYNGPCKQRRARRREPSLLLAESAPSCHRRGSSKHSKCLLRTSYPCKSVLPPLIPNRSTGVCLKTSASVARSSKTVER